MATHVVDHANHRRAGRVGLRSPRRRQGKKPTFSHRDRLWRTGRKENEQARTGSTEPSLNLPLAKIRWFDEKSLARFGARPGRSLCMHQPVELLDPDDANLWRSETCPTETCPTRPLRWPFIPEPTSLTALTIPNSLPEKPTGRTQINCLLPPAL